MLLQLIHAMITYTLTLAKHDRSKKMCWQCKGSGMVRRWYKDANGKNQYEDTVCDVCKGSGTLEG